MTTAGDNGLFDNPIISFFYFLFFKKDKNREAGLDRCFPFSIASTTGRVTAGSRGSSAMFS